MREGVPDHLERVFRAASHEAEHDEDSGKKNSDANANPHEEFPHEHELPTTFGSETLSAVYSIRHNVFALVVVFAEQLRLKRFVTVERLFDDVESGIGRTNLFDLHLLAFELFIILKKSAENEQAMRWQIARL